MNTLEAYINKDGTLEICAEIDTEDFLRDRIEPNESLNVQFYDYCEVLGLDRDINSAEQFAKSLDGKGIYGDDSGPATINTYNNECLLSDILQYVYWEDENKDAHILLQIHNGGDVRRNYPPPKAYDIVGDITCIFDNARGVIFCNDCNLAWYTENAHDWNQDDSDGENLRDYQASKDKPKYHSKPDPNQKSLTRDWKAKLTEYDFQFDPETRKDSEVVWVDKDKRPHCPFCGGLLKIESFPV